jgi:hypothetical protein
MRGAYLAVSHTARGDGETDSAMRTYVPTTQRNRPSPLPCFVLRIASRGKIWRLRKARRMRSAS